MKQKVRIGKEDRKAMLALAGVLLAFVLYLGVRPMQGTAEDNDSSGSYVQDEVVDDSSHHGEDNGAEIAENIAAQPDTQRTIKRDTLPIRTERYPGPPKREQYPSKLSVGATIDLNGADTLLLRRVPGIGPSFARRIYKYRELLGGYYVVEQLQEVYGMDRERYDQISPYFVIRTAVKPLYITMDSIPRHPYLQYRHQNALRRLLQKNTYITWAMLMDSGAFSRDDSLRLAPYLQFPNADEQSVHE